MSAPVDTFNLPDGTPVKMGMKAPPELRFAAVPAWDAANPVLTEDECQDTDRLRQFLSPIKTQHYNNCTNAALAGLGEALFRSCGMEVPTLSMSFNYARHNDGVDQGAMCRDLAYDFREVGMVPDALYPENRVVSRPSAEVVAKAKEITALEVYQCLDWSHVRSALARDFFVYHGFVLGQAFFNVGRDGKVPRWDGRIANGHAMFSCGLTRRFGDLRTIMPNSWGVSFGDQGVGYCDSSYFWDRRGNFVNLDAFAIRAVKRLKTDDLPVAV